jgi:hypothetical protein
MILGSYIICTASVRDHTYQPEDPRKTMSRDSSLSISKILTVEEHSRVPKTFLISSTYALPGAIK